MSMIEDTGAIQGMSAFYVFIVFFVLVINRDLKEYKQGYKNMKIITVAWFVNLIVFTSVLWIGEYALFNGIEWIRTPCQVTLASTGAAKALLTIMLILAIMDGKKFKEAE